jgi:structural maintenance of chromosome 4
VLQIALNEKALKKASAAVSELEGEIKALHDKILDIGGVRLKAQKAKVASIQDEIDTKQGQITKATVSLKNARKKVDAGNDKIGKLERDREETQRHAEGMNDEFQRIEEDAKKVLDAMTDAKRLMDDKEETLAEWKAKYETIEAGVAELRKLEVDLKEQLSAAERAAKEYAAKARHWRDELKTLRIETTGLADEDKDAEGAPLPVCYAMQAPPTHSLPGRPWLL